MRRISRKWFIRFMIILVILGVTFYGYRSYKKARVEDEAVRVSEILKSDILDSNPVRFKYIFGRSEPAWFGRTNLSYVFETPTGAEICITAFIDSSLTSTRLSMLEISCPGLNLEKRSIKDLSQLLQHLSGERVILPIETVGSGQPVDLRKLFPAAFGE